MAGNVTGVVRPAALNAAERSVLFEAIRVGDMPKIQPEALLKDRPGPAMRQSLAMTSDKPLSTLRPDMAAFRL